MSEFNTRPDNNAEQLIQSVFDRLTGQADPVIARLRLERSLERRPRRRRVSTAIKVLAFITGLLALGGWASGAPVIGWDDGQLITIQAPDSFVPAAYPHWVGVFANHAEALADHGGHSLIVDYRQGSDDSYFLQLGIIGVSYTEANDWLRDVMQRVPELNGTPYTITQPLLPFRVSVREMLAYSVLGRTEAEERKVVAAWRAAESQAQQVAMGRHAQIALIARSNDCRRVSMVGF